jgi:hypothetical protein
MAAQRDAVGGVVTGGAVAAGSAKRSIPIISYLLTVPARTKYSRLLR